MKTIIFLNNKGGVGKTASVTTIAHMLVSEHQKRVLLIDLDPQMNTTCMYSEVDFVQIFLNIYQGRQTEGKGSVEDLLLNREADIYACIQHTDFEGLDIIPSHLTLAEAEERMKGDVKSPQQFRLKRHLEKIQDEYDYCLIDTSPSVSIINVNGLAAADEVYIPLRCDGGSLLGAAITMTLVETVAEYHPGLKIGGMFFTQWNGRKNVSKTVYEMLKDQFGEFLLPITIRTGKDMEECTLMQLPLGAYDDRKKKANVTLDYLALTEYILKKG